MESTTKESNNVSLGHLFMLIFQTFTVVNAPQPDPSQLLDKKAGIATLGTERTGGNESDNGSNERGSGLINAYND